MPARWQIFPGISPNCCHTRLSWACVYVRCRLSFFSFLNKCICVWLNVWVTDRKWKSWCKCIRRWDELGLANHTCGSVRKQSALRVKPQHLSRRRIVPEQGTWSLWGHPKSAPCHLLCVSLTLCLLHPFLLASPPLPAQPLLSSALLFRQQEKWHLLMANLCAWPPRNLNCASTILGDCPSIPVTIRAPNTSIFRAHQLCMRWLGVIYGTKSISSSADLHRYRYGVISSWLGF